MVRNRKEKSIKDIKLKQPDRSGPDPDKKTLLDIANERRLFEQADEKQRSNDANTSGKKPTITKKMVSTKSGMVPEEDLLSPGAERFLEAVLWTATLAMLHFSFDVLVQNQYGMGLEWDKLMVRGAQSWIVFFILFYPLHPHEANPRLVPGLALKYQKPLRQLLFFVMSISSGCYLIYITNNFGYLALLKRAPPLGCLWVWAVIEMELVWAALSLVVAAGFLWWNGYDIK